MTVQVLGVRHHSPACARLVRRAIEEQRPAAVLIEGPGDFNARIGELLLAHTLPIALYSYANENQEPAQCWFPFLDYSPEWVALRAAHASGALLRFIDLPHWQYRAIPDAREQIADPSAAPPRSRYAQVVQQLCQRLGCDGENALWDHLFESDIEDAELRQRLDLYFDELRGDDAGTPQDQARELQMARWVSWAQGQFPRGDVLVICGGWHKRAIETLWPLQAVEAEPVSLIPADVRAAGCYLVPYEYRQVDALGGYWSGMQSPMFYQWVWRHGLGGAGERAIECLTQRLRAKGVSLSTADLVAMRQAMHMLAQLRGRSVPLRGDILDALQSSIIKEALEAPPPWVTQGLLGAQHHPALREALIALTGEGGGSLHADTPLPPLVHDVAARLAQCGLAPVAARQMVVLDRRQVADLPRARLLWQLRLIGLEGVQLTATRSPNAARSLPPTLAFEEHWTLTRDAHWFPNLIEAAAYGATLEGAARQRLAEEVRKAKGDVALAAHCLLKAVRAGLHDMGAALGHELEAATAQAHDLGALAAAAQVLLEVVRAGFWGEDTRGVLESALAVLAARLLRLLEGRQGSQGRQMEADVASVSVLDTLLRLQLEGAAGLERTAMLETLLRLAHDSRSPPALRGCALAVAYGQGALGDHAAERILALVRAVPPRDELGDFLYGLFSCARALATGSDVIAGAVHEAIEAMSTEDYLVALPQLRAAFSWFPPRERGAIAALVARLLGLSCDEQAGLLSLRGGSAAMLDGKAIELQALAWAHALGIAT